ncbi:MAG TPA: YceI family protein [Gemmatimonadales bacterium]|nr:YceI family protein [Gemmatimonadales bacterium]
MAAPVLPLLLALIAVQQPRDSLVYVLSPASRFQLKTGKAGLLGFAGHSHLVSARAFSGRIVYYPDTPADSHVEITVPADSLEVLTGADTTEIRKITEAMRTEVLRVGDYTTITFASTAVTSTDFGFQVLGELTLVGQTREVTVDMQTEIGTDTLRATGNFSVKQTDFGIKPYRGGPGGLVRVADRVTFTLEAVGIRLQGQ